MSLPAQSLRGITTLVWGTNNTSNNPNTFATSSTAGAICETLRITPKNGSPIEIEDNNGFAAALVLLDDGFDAAATLVYDGNKTWPSMNTNVQLSLPNYAANASSNVPSFATYNCIVGAIPEIDMARKREATIAYKIVYRPGITVT